MTEINYGDMVVVQMRNGMIFVGKMQELGEQGAKVSSPRVVQGKQKGVGVEISLVSLIGRPEELEIAGPDILFIYPLKDGELIALYIKETTGLTLAHASDLKQ